MRQNTCSKPLHQDQWLVWGILLKKDHCCVHHCSQFSSLSSRWSHINMIIVLEVNHDQWNSIIMIIRIFSPKIISMINYSIILFTHLRISRSPRQALQVKQDLWNQRFSETRTFSASKTAPKHQLRSWSFHRTEALMIWFHYLAAAHLYF